MNCVTAKWNLATCCLCIACMSIAKSAHSDIMPRNGTFEGVYHRDRWGVSLFGPFYVHPSLHGNLKDFEGKRIKLVVNSALQRENPGPSIITEIGAIEVLPDASSLEVELSIKRLVAESRRYELTCWFNNSGKDPVDASLQRLAIKVRHPPRGQWNNDPSFHLPEYTNGQEAIGSTTLQWLNNQLVVSRAGIESGHHIRIRPGERFPVVTTLNLEADEAEFCVYFSARSKRTRHPMQETWIELPLDDAPLVSQEESSNLRLDTVKLVPDRDGWHRLDFTIRCDDSLTRSVVACLQGPSPLIAGVLTSTDEKERTQRIDPKPCYWCSNMGEPWELVDVPAEGLSTSLLVKPERPRQFTLRLLTDQGLETLTLSP